MTPACFLIDDSVVTADLRVLAAETLLGRHELYPAVTVPVVVPVHNRCDPLAGLFLGREWAHLVFRPVLGRA
jgi:hypothetical protein